MMRIWNRLSAFTRLLAILVLVAGIGGSYARLRLQPLRKNLRIAERDVAALRKSVQKDRATVQQLEREATLALRWADYARILEDQSTGRSLRDVVATCGTGDGPDVEIESAEFERQDRAGGFSRLAVRLQVRGDYEELVALLHELDRAFPPIALTRASFERPESSEELAGAQIGAQLEGVIHESN